MDEHIGPIEALARPHGQDDNLPRIDGGPDEVAQEAKSRKAKEILDACQRGDAQHLRTLAESPGGFLSDKLRRSSWPILLGLPQSGQTAEVQECNRGKSECPDGEDWEQLPKHRDEDQVQLDVNRSFIYYPNDQSEIELEKCKAELFSLIIEVLRRHPYLCYFQGYHDICQVFLLVMQPTSRARLVERLSILRIRDFMLPSLGPTTTQLRLLPDILGKADRDLRKHIATIEPFYALAGTLTMYAHNIEAYRDISRLFDVFLAREPVFTIYVFAQIVLDRRDEILEIDEADMLQVVLAKVPPNMDIDTLIVNAVSLFNKFPPEGLGSWRYISEASALKTARDTQSFGSQTLEMGQAYFEEQAKEVRWLEMREKAVLTLWRYRRPIKAIGMAAAVAAMAVYLRRHPSAVHHVLSIFGAGIRP